ncbi:hypothetical protein Nepgr_018741 [Nepenthes gracilis]|uniref:Uncharacterized protein n=1 Tax=Nepenthes gracilis TaxID=150966 RepID=A0AAD3SU04_NEPGR|nr:hypothetical protein Nepgr_018741 [Nepenthes gracilis]
MCLIQPPHDLSGRSHVIDDALALPACSLNDDKRVCYSWDKVVVHFNAEIALLGKLSTCGYVGVLLRWPPSVGLQKWPVVNRRTLYWMTMGWSFAKFEVHFSGVEGRQSMGCPDVLVTLDVTSDMGTTSCDKGPALVQGDGCAAAEWLRTAGLYRAGFEES